MGEGKGEKKDKTGGRTFAAQDVVLGRVAHCRWWRIRQQHGDHYDPRLPRGNGESPREMTVKRAPENPVARSAPLSH